MLLPTTSLPFTSGIAPRFVWGSTPGPARPSTTCGILFLSAAPRLLPSVVTSRPPPSCSASGPASFSPASIFPPFWASLQPCLPQASLQLGSSSLELRLRPLLSSAALALGSAGPPTPSTLVSRSSSRRCCPLTPPRPAQSPAPGWRKLVSLPALSPASRLSPSSPPGPAPTPPLHSPRLSSGPFLSLA